MAYTLNSAKDSQGDEHRFVENFQRQLPAILAYKREHGGDLEGAYGQVTGTAWPAGRSVKLKDGQGVMTKDRTVKSVLGKYVALPAALAATAVFAPGALPAVGKATLGAGKALAGLAGVSGGAGTGGGIGAGTLGAGAGLGSTTGMIGASTGIGGAASIGGAVAAGTKLAGLIGPLGKAVGAASQQSAENRAAQPGADAVGVQTDRQAMRNASITSYLAGGGASGLQRPDVFAGLFGGKYSPPGTSGAQNPQGVLTAEQQFAKAMQEDLLRRQREGKSLTASGIQGPGRMEQLAQWAGPAMSILGRR